MFLEVEQAAPHVHIHFVGGWHLVDDTQSPSECEKPLSKMGLRQISHGPSWLEAVSENSSQGTPIPESLHPSGPGRFHPSIPADLHPNVPGGLPPSILGIFHFSVSGNLHLPHLTTVPAQPRQEGLD